MSSKVRGVLPETEPNREDLSCTKWHFKKEIEMKATVSLKVENSDGTLFHSTVSEFPGLDKVGVGYLEDKLIGVLKSLNDESKTRLAAASR